MKSDQALLEIKNYGLLNNEQDEELNELVEIVSILCDVPIALITITDEDNQYFIARKGLNMERVALEDSFCKYTLESDKPLFTVKNALEHDDFKTNKYVVGEPNVRFYTGAALITPGGTKIGTLCLLDYQERELSAEKSKIIELTAKRVVKVLERRKQIVSQSKQIEVDQQRLRHLTDNAPGALFQLNFHHDEDRYEFSFVSAGISRLHPALSPKHLKSDPFLLADLIHNADRESFQNSIGAAIRDFRPWNKEFRLITNEGSIWVRGVAVPRRHENTTEWYGLFENINYLKEYQLTLEGIAFDISHGLRRPVSNLLGLVDLFEDGRMSKTDNVNFKTYVKEVSQELEKFTHQLNKTYSQKHEDLQKKIGQIEPEKDGPTVE